MDEVYVLITFYEDILDKVDVYLDRDQAEEVHYKLIRELLLGLDDDFKKMIFEGTIGDIDVEIKTASTAQLDEFYQWYVDMSGGAAEHEYRLFIIEPIAKEQEECLKE